MKSKFIVAIVAVTSMLIACKNEKTADKIETAENKKNDGLKISLTLIAPLEDSLQVYYTEDEYGDYNDMNSVWSVIKGNDSTQTAVFEIPEDVYPTHLRLDLGQNKDQKEIQIKEFAMEFQGKKFQVKDTLFFQYFQPVNQIDWDRKNAIAKIVTPEGQKHDPSFNPRETLKEELKKLME